ncbi:MAG: UvrD-helicase domain-containing protein, partial [Pseudomonadota bacterium]
MSTAAEATLSRLIEETTLAQRRASDPGRSAWVSANAGSGKTHVLKMRVQRLLLAGVPPNRILCLTFTKAAAAQMSRRVFDDLARWAVLPDDALATALTGLMGTPPDAPTLAGARRQFANAIETPGGLKVQTIHAFCQDVLQRFPLEAALTPGFATIDDITKAQLMRRATDAMLTAATRSDAVPDPEHLTLADALTTVIAFAADDQFDTVLDQALHRRQWLALMAGLAAVSADRNTIDLFYRTVLKLDGDATTDAIMRAIAEAVGNNQLRADAATLTQSSKSTDVSRGKTLARAEDADGYTERAELLLRALLTQKHTAVKNPATKEAEENAPGVQERLKEVAARLEALVATRHAIMLSDASAALATLASDVAQRYARAKSEAAKLDFDDLIARTSELLAAPGQAEWVLYKLDGGIDHILIDEAQDTSGLQWSIAQQLAGDFFTGACDRELPRTVFAVGDEKQSIYSFQGAQPELFAEAGRHFAADAAAIDAPFAHVPLTVSFRTVSPVLAAVDAVFADPTRTPGLGRGGAGGDGATGVTHQATRLGAAGRVEIWPLPDYAASAPSNAFTPLDEDDADVAGSASAVATLSAEIADTIATWLRDQRMLAARGRPVTPGDILILLKRRRPLGPAIISALKRRGIPVAGADRMVLLDQVIVQDLMALGDFLTLPDNDLALANVLKSPLFDFDDDDLMRIACGQRGSLWSALLLSAKTMPDGPDARAAEILKGWRKTADYLPPFEYMAGLLNAPSHLDPSGTVRARLLRRLGADAADPLDEFLELALSYDD